MLLNPIVLSFDMIRDVFWKFSHENSVVVSEVLKFLPDGTVGGYQHENERYWHLEDNTLCLSNSTKIVTTRFGVVSSSTANVLLRGLHIPDPSIILILESNLQGRVVHSETQRAFSKEIEVLGWCIGDHTYGVPSIAEKTIAKLIIGKYCSIADDVKISLGDHKTDIFTTYPFKTLRKYWNNVPNDVEDHSTRGDVVIGNDVWIGNGVFIGSGVSVGDGAVLGAKSVIVKDVPPYAIVVGNPGRIVRYRFDAFTIGELLKLAWWNLSDDLVDAVLPFLMSNNNSILLKVLMQAKSGEQIACNMQPDQSA